MSKQKQNPDLHGYVPDTSDVALVLIDVINDLNFPEADGMLEHAIPMAERLAALKKAEFPQSMVASNTLEENSHALKQMEKVLKAEIRHSTKIPLKTQTG